MDWIVSVLLCAVLVVVDQLIKAWATAVLAPVGTMPLLPGIIQLRYVLNDGAAFSMLAGKQGFLIAFTGAALAAVAAYLVIRRPKGLDRAAWLLILAGGIGNLIDRAANHMVVDYLDVQFMTFAVFNFADVCVCTGVGLLILSLILEEVHARSSAKHEDENHGDT